MSAPYRHIQVTPIAAALGAHIEGVDLSKPLGDEVKAEIHRAFLDHAVVLFRGQDLDPASQMAFTRLFGAVDQHPLYRSNQIEGFPEILVIEHKEGKFLNGRNDIWHADVTFAEQPPLGSVLACKHGRAGWGDTLFASLTRAFDALSPGMQRLLTPLQGVHSAKVLQDRNNAAKENIPVTEIPPPVEHPVVREHPENGRPTLFVNCAYTVGIKDMRPE
ncbi:MAG: TauD/TfdA family dioxygenase, partial [Planctomycetes bacterium]|nr:TauD/TfdA family dioxygenase [Planctomycetota bacterium]